jgi:hypothetical protein
MTELAAAGPARPLEWVRANAWIAGWWAASRALVLATAVLMHLVGPRGLIGHDERAHVLGTLGAWDGLWYRTVAANGYLLQSGRQSDPAFFPLYPLLLRVLHGLGLGYVAAGVVLSQVAFLGALAAFEVLTRELFGPSFAHRTVVYLALFPMGFVFSLAYPESVVLCAIVLAAVAALRGRWITTAILMALGSLARPETLFISIPLLALALRERVPQRRGPAFGAVLAPFAALGSFALYLALTLHDPLAWTHAERAWGRRFTPFGMITAIRDLPRAVEGNAWVLRDVAFLLVYLALLWAALRANVPRSWVAAGAIVVVLPTFSGSFHSIGRFGLLAPAAFWGLAARGATRRTDTAIRAVSAVLLIGGTFSLAWVFP